MSAMAANVPVEERMKRLSMRIEQGTNLKNRTEAHRQILVNQLKDLEKESMTKFGVAPSELPARITQTEESLDQMLDEIEQLLPEGV